MLDWLKELLGQGFTEEVEARAVQELKALEKGHGQALLERQEAHEAKVKGLRLLHAVDLALLENGARSRRAARALLDFDSLELGEGESVDGLDEQLAALKESDGYLFAGKEEPPLIQGICLAEGAELPGGRSPGEMGYEELCAYFGGE